VGADTRKYGRVGSATGDGVTAARELRRVLRPGGVAWISVPFGRAADHGWFHVVDSPGLQALIDGFAPTSVHATYFRHGTHWQVASEAECADATYGHRTIAAEAVACIELHV
jgi:hypothetical protein